jgi:rubredoxin
MAPEETVATCDRCGSCRWEPLADGWVCGDCDAVYNRDGIRVTTNEHDQEERTE